MAVTIKDIAKAAGVSRGTVDRVLHSRSGVNSDVAERIRQLADEMGFIPNKAGKILAARKQPIRFGCLLPDVGNPFFIDVIQGFRRAERELSDYGVSVDIKHIRGFDSSVHQDAIRQLAAEEYSGLCLATIDLPEIQLAVHNVIHHGIPVIAVNTDIPDSGRICYIGPDYQKEGRTAASMLSLITKGKLHILIVTGSFYIRGHNERIRGFFEGLKDHQVEYSVVNTIESFDDDIKSFKQTKKILEEHSDINCIFIVAAGVSGVCSAVSSLNRKFIKILAFDEIPATVRLVKSGLIDFTICQEPEIQGYTAITYLFSYLMSEGKKNPKDFITKTIIKIAENID